MKRRMTKARPATPPTTPPINAGVAGLGFGLNPFPPLPGEFVATPPPRVGAPDPRGNVLPLVVDVKTDLIDVDVSSVLELASEEVVVELCEESKGEDVSDILAAEDEKLEFEIEDDNDELGTMVALLEKTEEDAAADDCSLVVLVLADALLAADDVEGEVEVDSSDETLALVDPLLVPVVAEADVEMN